MDPRPDSRSSERTDASAGTNLGTGADATTLERRARRRHLIKLCGLSGLLLALAVFASGISPRRPAAPPLDVRLVARAAIDTGRALIPPPELKPAAKLGQFDLTYYWLAAERRHKPRTLQLFNRSCKPIARVSARFADRVQLEGSGRLRSGRVIKYIGSCSCPSVRCFKLAPARYTWSTGASGRPLQPFRSVAVDPRKVALGSVLYIAELDGVQMPAVTASDSFIHDGCVVADDRGGGVRGRHIDFFAAERRYFRSLRPHLDQTVTVYQGGERCARLQPGGPATADDTTSASTEPPVAGDANAASQAPQTPS